MTSDLYSHLQKQTAATAAKMMDAVPGGLAARGETQLLQIHTAPFALLRDCHLPYVNGAKDFVAESVTLMACSPARLHG